MPSSDIAISSRPAIHADSVHTDDATNNKSKASASTDIHFESSGVPAEVKISAFIWAQNGRGEIFDLATWENTPRECAKYSGGKQTGSLPLIAKNEKTRAQLEIKKNEYIAKTSGISDQTYQKVENQKKIVSELKCEHEKIKDELHGDLQKNATNTALWRKLSQAAERYHAAENELKKLKGDDYVARLHNVAAQETQILGPEALNRVSDAGKAYITGHGGPGSRSIEYGTSSRYFNAKEIPLQSIAQSLAKKGLAPAFSDFRLVSCSSADAVPRTRFEANGAVEPLSTEVKPEASSAVKPRRSGPIASAQHLANELGKAGFDNPRVRGYQGAGLVKPLRNAEGPWHNGQIINANDPAFSAVRRKDVAVDFKPKE